jgi:hypothetical protein
MPTVAEEDCYISCATITEQLKPSSKVWHSMFYSYNVNNFFSRWYLKRILPEIKQEFPCSLHYNGKDYAGHDLRLLQRGWTSNYTCVKKLSCDCPAKLSEDWIVYCQHEKAFGGMFIKCY